MDILLLIGLIVVIGSVIAFYRRGFRMYWIFSLITATVLSILYQIFAYLEAGYLDPFHKVAFVVSWIVFFGIASIGYAAYRFVKSRKVQDSAAPKQP